MSILYIKIAKHLESDMTSKDYYIYGLIYILLILFIIYSKWYNE